MNIAKIQSLLGAYTKGGFELQLRVWDNQANTNVETVYVFFELALPFVLFDRAVLLFALQLQNKLRYFCTVYVLFVKIQS